MSDRVVTSGEVRCPSCATDWTLERDGSAAISRTRSIFPDTDGWLRCCDGFRFRTTPEPED